MIASKKRWRLEAERKGKGRATQAWLMETVPKRGLMGFTHPTVGSGLACRMGGTHRLSVGKRWRLEAERKGKGAAQAGMDFRAALVRPASSLRPPAALAR